jgi:hypothetical protein
MFEYSNLSYHYRGSSSSSNYYSLYSINCTDSVSAEQYRWRVRSTSDYSFSFVFWTNVQGSMAFSNVTSLPIGYGNEPKPVNRAGIIAGVVIGLVVAAVVIAAFVIYRKRSKENNPNEIYLLQNEGRTQP